MDLSEKRLKLINENILSLKQDINKIDKYILSIKIIKSILTITSVGINCTAITLSTITLAGGFPLSILIIIALGSSTSNVFEICLRKLGINKALKNYSKRRSIYNKYHKRLKFFRNKFLIDGLISKEEYQDYLKLIQKFNTKLEEIERGTNHSNSVESYDDT